MNYNLMKIAPLALLLGGLNAICFAQMATGNIGGQVEDSSVAVLPGTKVTLILGATRLVTTNERGEFLAPLLPIGEYEVSAEFQGFKRSTVSGVRLLVDQTLIGSTESEQCRRASAETDERK